MKEYEYPPLNSNIIRNRSLNDFRTLQPELNKYLVKRQRGSDFKLSYSAV